MLPRAQRASSRVPRQRPGPPTSSRQQGHAQVISTLRGAVHHPRSASTWDLQAPIRGWEGRLQCIKH
jgi:hypothetical protein